MRTAVLRRSSLLFAVLAVSGLARANNIAWNNSAGGNFSTGTNWVGNLPAGLLDTASFNLASTGYTVALTSSPSNGQLSVGTDNVTLNLQNNAYALTNAADSAGNHSVEVGSATGGSLTIENTAGGSGSLTSVFASIGVSSGQTGTVTVTGAGTTWNGTEYINVGDAGNGTLNVDKGASVTDLVGSIGNSSGGNGSVYIDGAGSVWNTTNWFYVGYQSPGSLTVQNGGKILNQVTYVGRYAAGSATVTGANSSWSTATFDVGYDAPGTVSILNGATLTDNDATLSCSASGPGTITVGANSTWTTSDALNVGSASAAILNIQGGSVSVGGNFAISNHAGTEVNLSAGKLSVGYINTSLNPSLFLGDGVTTGWTGGTLQITKSGLTVGSGGMLGSNLTLGSGKSLQITGSGQTLAINSGSTLNVAGGSVLANTLNNAGTLSLPKGSSVEAVNPLVNTGLINISGGTLQLDAGTSGSTVRSQLLAGYDNGGWDGTSGITSSFAYGHIATAVGYTTSGSVTKVFTTWYGDANGDGVVNSADLASISNSGTTWQTGDFNYDGVVNEDDYSLFFLGSLFGSGNISTVLPEPTSLVMLLPMAGLLRRRR